MFLQGRLQLRCRLQGLHRIGLKYLSFDYSFFENVLTKLKISMNVFLVRSALILQFVEISMVLTIVNVLKVSLVLCSILIGHFRI